MSSVIKILSGIGVLIAIYLFLANGSNTTKIINSIGTNTIEGIQVLQGRSKIIT